MEFIFISRFDFYFWVLLEDIKQFSDEFIPLLMFVWKYTLQTIERRIFENFWKIKYYNIILEAITNF